jgi:hypothetical protein
VKLLRRRRPTDDIKATVTITDSSKRTAAEYEVPVTTLAELYTACREAAGTGLVEVTLLGPSGKVSLKFGSMVRRRPPT